MQPSTTLRQAIRLAIGSSLGVAAALAAQPSLAQSQDSARIEEIVVTGSRIARDANFEGAAPVVTLDREEIEKAGYNNLQQLLEKLPATGNGTFSTRGNNQDSTANGAAGISLRGLGADATLVLVNGRRVAISAFAESITTNFVDINTIPVAAIERVEVLKDGASALYGSDAVAGVVNIILRKDYEGLELSGSYGATTESGMDEKSLTAVWGSGSDTSNVTVILDYFTNSTLGNAERGTLGSANQSARGGEDFRSSRGFPGRFIVTAPNASPPPASVTATRIDPGCPADRRAGQTCVYDYGPWNLLVPESERVGFMLSGHQDFASGITAFTEIAVQHNTSIAQGAPTPLDETAGLTVPITHPNNPYADATAIAIGRYRTVDAGARQWDIRTNNLRLLVGLRGELAGWGWEVGAQRARAETEQTGSRSQGWIRTDYLQREINAGRYNPFGGTFNPQSVIDDITTSLVRRGQSDLKGVDASVTGELFDLPAGAVRMAAGVEYREERISDIPDEQFQRGLIFGTEAVSASASRDNFSAFVEVAVPVVSGLELSLATRFDDYSDFGNTTNPKLSLRWDLFDTFALRGSWGKGFRAPSLAQIGLGPSEESQFFIDTFGCADNPTYCASTDYTIVFSGNPDLKPEKSEAWNFGFAWEVLDGLKVTMDYWNISQEAKIDEVPFGFIYANECNNQASTVCVRGAPLTGDTLGPLQEINAGFINIGEQNAAGIDLDAAWTTELMGGALRLGLNYSYLSKFERVELRPNLTGFVTRSLDGEYEYPTDRWVLSGDWGSEDWGFGGSLNYIGSFEDTPDIDFDGTLDYDTNRSRSVSAMMTVNLQVRYTGIEGVTFTLGADNALDKAPPFAIGDGDGDLYGYVSGVHNPRGRFVYGKVSYKF